MNRLGWFAPGHPAGLVMGFTIWSVWFIAMYGGLSVACQQVPPATEQGAVTWLNGSLLLFTLLVLALLLWLAWRSGRYCVSLQAGVADNSGVTRFIGYASAALHLIAAIAVLAGSLPVLVFTPCS